MPAHPSNGAFPTQGCGEAEANCTKNKRQYTWKQEERCKGAAQATANMAGAEGGEATYS
jgi:hypothetical protein